MTGTLFFTAQEVAEMLGVSRAQAYRIIKMLNDELKKKGNYIVISGKVSKKYFSERYYGGVTMEGGEI